MTILKKTLIKEKDWLICVLIVIILIIYLTQFTILDNPFLVIIKGIIVTLYLVVFPGYSICKGLFRTEEALNTLVVSIGLSSLITPSLGLILYVIYKEVKLNHMIVSLSTFIIIFSILVPLTIAARAGRASQLKRFY